MPSDFRRSDAPPHFLLAALFLATSMQPAAAAGADAIYFGGPIITVNDNQPDAEAVAVKDGKIVAVGTRADIEKAEKGGKTKLVDLAGRTMIPGLIDAHGHVFTTGIQALSANILPPPDGEGADVASLQRLLKDWAAKNQAAIDKVGWILGFGYDNSQLKEQRHPTREELDVVSTEMPVVSSTSPGTWP